VTVPAAGEAQLNGRVTLPDNLADGDQTLALRLKFKDDERVVGGSGAVSFVFKKDLAPQVFAFLPNWLLIVAIAGIIILLLLFILLVHVMRTRGFHLSLRHTLDADTLSGDAGRGRNRHGHYDENSHHSYALEMIVGFQKRHIGQRNIRRIPTGKALSVGGGSSAFLIFLVPVPARIAEISFNSGTFTFTPIRMEFFPELKGELRNCLETPIKTVSRRGYVLEIQFRRYVSPLDEINAIFNRFYGKS
jgi:hypothetical protein